MPELRREAWRATSRQRRTRAHSSDGIRAAVCVGRRMRSTLCRGYSTAHEEPRSCERARCGQRMRPQHTHYDDIMKKTTPTAATMMQHIQQTTAYFLKK